MEVAVAVPAAPPRAAILSRRLRCYILLLMVTLPMDWFDPTGKLLREAGARPAIPLMVGASFFILLFHASWITELMSRSTLR